MTEVQPNKQKIESLFAAIKTGGTDEILSACETLIVEDVSVDLLFDVDTY